MKEIYLNLLSKLEALGWLQWVDLDKGQFAVQQRPEVSFPCCLIKVANVTAQTVNEDYQIITANITLRVGFTFVGITALATPEAERNISLEYLDNIEEIYQAINGKVNHQGRPYEFQAQSEQELTGIRGVNMTFRTFFKKEIA